jgi:hypothetical protein
MIEKVEQCDRIAELREALAKIEQGDIPRPVAHHWRRDLKPSKHDQCEHLRSMWQDCGDCVALFARAALGDRS